MRIHPFCTKWATYIYIVSFKCPNNPIIFEDWELNVLKVRTKSCPGLQQKLSYCQCLDPANLTLELTCLTAFNFRPVWFSYSSLRSIKIYQIRQCFWAKIELGAESLLRNFQFICSIPLSSCTPAIESPYMALDKLPKSLWSILINKFYHRHHMSITL